MRRRLAGAVLLLIGVGGFTALNANTGFVAERVSKAYAGVFCAVVDIACLAMVWVGCSLAFRPRPK